MKFYFLLLILSSVPVKESFQWEEFIIWNVGQGSFNTIVQNDLCLIWDIGGERFPQKKFLQVCKGKKFKLFLSHDDRDHVCFQNRLQKMISSTAKDTETKIMYHGKGDSNEESSVYYSSTWQILFPGDSTKEKETVWGKHITPDVKGFILGHHGSLTSNSYELLTKLKHLKWAAVSARQKRYGHPHPIVEQRLRKLKIPLIKTEHWGHLRFLRNPRSQTSGL